MDLSSIIDNKLKKITMRKIKRKRPKLTEEQMYRKKMREAIRLIKTGEYNPKLMSHRIAVFKAHKEGYVDRINGVVLKEI